MDIKKLLVGNAAGLLRKQNSVKDNQPVVIEDVGLKIWKDLIEEPAREIEDVINTQMKKLKDAIKIDSSAEVKKEKLGILSKIIVGTNSNAADS
jgi:proteasome assembly chaperone (PAC2) family protein